MEVYTANLKTSSPVPAFEEDLKKAVLSATPEIASKLLEVCYSSSSEIIKNIAPSEEELEIRRQRKKDVKKKELMKEILEEDIEKKRLEKSIEDEIQFNRNVGV